MYNKYMSLFICKTQEIIETVFPVYNKKSNTFEEGDELEKQIDKLENK